MPNPIDAIVPTAVGPFSRYRGTGSGTGSAVREGTPPGSPDSTLGLLGIGAAQVFNNWYGVREQTTISPAFGDSVVKPPLRPDDIGYRRWPNSSPGGGGSGGSGGFSESRDLDELDWEAEASSGGGAGYYWGWYKGVNVRHDGPTPSGFASEAQARLDDPGATKVLDTAGATKAAPTTPAQIGPSMRADDRSWASKFFHETYAKATGFFTTPTATPASRVYHLAAKPAAVGFVDGAQNLYGMVRHPITTAKNAVRGVYVVVTNPGAVGEAAYHQYVEFQTLPSNQKAAAVSRFAGEAVFDAATGKLLLRGIRGTKSVQSTIPSGPVFNEGVRATEFADPALLRKLESRGFAIDQSDEIVRYLDSRGANAGTFLDRDLHLRPDARKLEVLEEYLHNIQNRIGLTNKLSPGATGGLEMHVKDFMIRHRHLLGINDADAVWLETWLATARRINAGG